MSSTARVLSVLNFLTGEGVNYFPEGCDGSAIEALITDYFNEGQSDDKSDKECDHKNDGKYLYLKYFTNNVLLYCRSPRDSNGKYE